MASTATTRQFRTRAIAIAVVGSVALGGLAVVWPEGSVLAAPAAVAQETGTYAPSNIKHLGFFDPDGNEYTGLLTNAAVAGLRPEGSTFSARPGSYVKLNITVPEGVKAGDGAFIKFSEDPKIGVPAVTYSASTDLVMNNIVIGKIENTSYGAKITFNENAARVKNASADYILRMHSIAYLTWTGAEHQRRQEAGLPAEGLSDVLPVSVNVYPVVNGKIGSQATTIETPLTMQNYATWLEEDTNKKRFVVGAHIGDASNDRVTVLNGTVQTPINDPDIYPGASDTYDVTVYPYVSPKN